MSKDWQKFEKLACNVQRDLSPNAKVTHNENIRGKSGIINQCDVVIRSKIGTIGFLGIIECKDHSSKIGVEVVRNFKAKLEDIGAMKGIIVSSEGFTKDAHLYAKKHGIDAYLLVDANSIKWNKHAIVPLVLCEVYLSSCQCFNYRVDNRQEICLKYDNGQPAGTNEYCYWDNEAQEYIYLTKLVEKIWDENDTGKAFENGNINYKSEPGRYELFQGSKPRIPVILKLHLGSTYNYHYGHVSVQDGQGYLDEKTRQFHSKEFVCMPLDWEEALKKWPSTLDTKEIPFEPIIWLWIVRFFSPRKNHANKFFQMGGGMRI
jgi:hypothetical protein